MRCPLAVLEGATNLTVVRNSAFQDVEFPAKPHVFYRPELVPGNKDPLVEKVDLATKEKILLARAEFETPRDAQMFFNSMQKRGCHYNRPIDHILLEHPTFFRAPELLNTDPLKIMVIDIEVLSDGSGVFPTPSRNPIISVGAYTLGKEPVIFMDYNDKDKEYPDRKILTDFLAHFRREDPDLVVGYNTKSFDIPYIVNRLLHFKGKNKFPPKELSPTILTRNGRLPFVRYEREDQDEEVTEYFLWGRISMDLFHNVLKDQSLLGIKDRKLKTVLRWFKYAKEELVELDTRDMRPYVNTPDLARYQRSDLVGTGFLCENYLPPQVALAELIGIPLDLIINGFSSTIPKVYTGRRCVALNLVPLESNEDRYGAPRVKDKKGFEAAYVDIMKTGYFPSIYKVDFASLYPSLMTTFNLGPDTVTMCNTDLAYKADGFKITACKEMYYLEIPDANYQRNFLIRVDLSKDSFIREDMKALFEMRRNFKKEMKKHPEDSSDWMSMNSSNWAIKVLMNSIFGFEGLKYARYGDMAVGVAVVGLGRWLIQEAVKYLGDRVIEVDTDGIYADADVDADEMNRLVAGLVAESTRQKSYLLFEKEGPWPGYFYRAKNYVLRKGDKLIIHGGALKSSKACKAYDTAVRRLADAVLSGANHEGLKEVVMSLRDLSTYQLSDFLMHVTLGKSDYDKSKGVPMQVRLAEQAGARLKRKLRAGESIDYYKTNDELGYQTTDHVTSIDQLDREYYLDAISKAQEIFALQDIHKTPQQIEAEKRTERRLELIQRKRILNCIQERKPVRGDEAAWLERLKVEKDLAPEKAAALIAGIQTLQDAMAHDWPCPSCQAVGYDVEYPYLKCIACGFIGTPVQPPRRKGVRRKREVTADGIKITMGDKTFVLPLDWRTRREALLKRRQDRGYLTAAEFELLEQTEKELALEKKAAGMPLKEETADVA